ncbi:MAG: Crp/Fnr family transcriptional regulator [Butyricicoccus sp.]
MSGKEPQIIQQFHAGECFGEAVAFGEQKICVEIRTTKATRILYLPVDGLMKDMSDCDFTLMKTNLVREMSNKIAILNLKNQILAEPRLRKRILIYLNILPADKAGWKEVPFGQKELAQYLNANRSALSRELARMREDGLIETEGRKVKVLLTINELMML